MTKNITLVLLLVVIVVMGMRTIEPSKMAHIDMQELITSMPEAKIAFASLQKYQDSLTKDGQALLKEYMDKEKAFTASEKTLSPAIREAKIKELQTAQNSIQEYNGRMEQLLAARQQKITQPIIQKAQKAVNTVAAEKGIAYVVDNSKDVLVVAPGSDDLLPVVKTKLGIK
ncbi:MAG TPA: OmpH family outer membrane protein [Chitinophaga sp.]|uniref:OmpH family outer membrane protein n=1 Tax=Chitinophaga sp. TaxID=1869181 RepID=UPI002C5AFE41|nr:OmpH family outer membrane protein [Chitinophaga sp.]HVI43757.1 OmpH family outer membrane protein [Chitinophaga sp.]